MKLPESLIVFGKEIPIVLDDLGDELIGNTDGHTITISTKAKKKDYLGILLHELFHCYVRRAGIYHRNDWDTNLEEQLAEGFQIIIQENFILRAR